MYYGFPKDCFHAKETAWNWARVERTRFKWVRSIPAWTKKIFIEVNLCYFQNQWIKFHFCLDFPLVVLAKIFKITCTRYGGEGLHFLVACISSNTKYCFKIWKSLNKNVIHAIRYTTNSIVRCMYLSKLFLFMINKLWNVY